LAAALMSPPAEEAPAAEPVIGRFGEYELLSVAGRGGMGVVYRARHVRLGREVALKMVASPVLAGESAARRFRAEVEAMAGLDHSNIIPVYECGEVDGQAYYTMKFIEGGQLTARMRDDSWAQPDKIRLLVKVARAVEHAHRHGVLHRDLKPSNIMVDAAGEPYVCDFGLARRLEGDSSLTLSGAALGTPEYMAPEQAGGQKGQATTLADVYSLGAMLYELLAGRPPFRGSNALETMRQVMDDEPLSPSTVVRHADRDLETIALKCLAKEPARRYASAAAMADDLERWLRHEPITARRPGAIERARKWLRRHPAQATVIALLAAAGAVFLWQHWREEQRVKAERDRAEAGWSASRARLYAADMDAVAEALERGDYGVAVAKLEAHRPAPGQPDERGLEWHIYQRASAGSHAKQFAADGMVRHLAWSSDGTLLAAATALEKVYLWNVRDGSAAGIIPDKNVPNEWDLNYYKAKVLARKAQRGSADTGGALLNLVGLGETQNPVTNRAPASHGLAFSPDGSLLATADNDGTKFWRLRDRWLFDWLPGHAGAGIFLDNTKYLVAEEAPPHALGVFDLATGEWRVLHGSGGRLLTVAPDRRRAAVVNPGSQTMTVVSLPDGAVMGTWQDAAFGKAARIALLPDDSGVLVNSSGMPRLREGNWRQRAWRRWLGEGRFTDGDLFALSGNGAWLAMYDRQHRLRLHLGTDGTQEMLLRGARSPLRSMTWSPDHATLATGEEDGTVRLWQAGAGNRSWQVGSADLQGPLHLSPDGSRAAARTAGGDAIALLDLRSGDAQRIPDTSGGAPAGIAADGGVLYVMRQPEDALLAVKEWRDGKSATRIVLRDSRDWPFSANHVIEVQRGRWLLLQHDDRHFRLCDLTEGSLTWSASAEWDPLRAAVSPDSRALAFSQNKTLVLLDWPSAAPRRRVETGAPIHSLTWLPDGSLLAAGSADGVIRLYHPDMLRPAGTFRGHTGSVYAMHFSRDGRRLVSASADSRIRLWDMATLQPLGRLPAVDLGPRTLGGFCDGGNGIAALTWGDSLVVWRGMPPD
jgi:WD40 repeat protein